MSPYALYLASLAPSSAAAQSSSLRSMLSEWGASPADPALHPWHRWKPANTTGASAWLASHRAPATAARLWAALRQILRQCYRTGLLDRESYDRLVMVRGPVVGRVTSRRIERVPTAAEIRALFDAAAEQPYVQASRNAALLALAYGCGLRRRELADAMISDLAPVVMATESLPVVGKGGRMRLVALPSGARLALATYMTERRSRLGNNWNASQSLLLGTDARGSQFLLSGLSYAAIDGAIAGLCAQARLPRFSAHDLRRAYCSQLLAAGADISMVQRLMGHANITTTSLYDRRDDRALADAADLLVVPFTAPREPVLPPQALPLLPAASPA